MKVLIIGGGFAGCASAEILSHEKCQNKYSRKK